jgi:hypothetical protein
MVLRPDLGFSYGAELLGVSENRSADLKMQEVIMATPATRAKSARKTRSAVNPESRQTFPEYLGDITPMAANEMLRSLSNINHYVNSIRDAMDRAYGLDCLHDEGGTFVGLVLTPEKPDCYIESKIVPLAAKRLEPEEENK